MLEVVELVEFWFVRHGQTDWNRERRLQGWTDVELNSAGIDEAQRLGSAVEGIPFVHVYTSDLQRACVTAQIIQAHLTVPMMVDRRLRERRFGALEGTVRGSTLAREFEPDSEAEADTEVLLRVDSFLSEATARHGSGRLLVVTHGGIIRLLLRKFGCSPVKAIHNTGVCRIALDGPQIRIVAVNSANHLGL